MNAIGKFITFDGCEAAGKTTQIELLHRALLKEGIPNIVTREPGGTPFGEKIRALFLEDPDAVTTLSQIHLMFALRAQHVQTVILPALKRGEWVICDRFVDATRVYQGYMPDLYQEFESAEQLKHATESINLAVYDPSKSDYLDRIDEFYNEIDHLYNIDPILRHSDWAFPAHNFILDLPVEVIAERLAFRTLENQIGYDKKPARFHAFVRTCYRDHICQNYTNRTLIDATASILDVHHRILEQVISDVLI